MTDTKAKTPEAPPTDDGWERIDVHEFPDAILSWDDTNKVEGKIQWREVVPTKALDGTDRDSTMYCLLTGDGEVGVWGTANLDPQLAKIPDGSLVRIIYTDTKKLSGGRTMRRFTVDKATGHGHAGPE